MITLCAHVPMAERLEEGPPLGNAIVRVDRSTIKQIRISGTKRKQKNKFTIPKKYHKILHVQTEQRTTTKVFKLQKH